MFDNNLVSCPVGCAYILRFYDNALTITNNRVYLPGAAGPLDVYPGDKTCNTDIGVTSIT